MRLPLLFSLCLFAACVSAADIPSALRKNVTFHASFDKSGTDADMAKGDGKIYHAPNFAKDFGKAQAGFGDVDAVIEKGSGVKGGNALRFRTPNQKALFFRGDKHIALAAGTFSFWLRVDPAVDLWPNYTDPIQLTGNDYNDRALWVDFSKDERPRHFRLGVFGNLQGWNHNNPSPEKNPDFMKRLIIVKTPPFTREAWTHVAITWSGLGSKTGTASLYLNGKLIGAPASVPEPFSWNAEKFAIRLGVNYTGLMDELAAFDRTLTAQEVAGIHAAGTK